MTLSERLAWRQAEEARGAGGAGRVRGGADARRRAEARRHGGEAAVAAAQRLADRRLPPADPGQRQRIEALAANWEGLRAGTASFDEVAAGAGGAAGGGGAAAAARRRLVTAREREGGGAAPARRPAAEVVDLTGSSPRLPRPRERPPPARAGEAQLSMTARLRAELAGCRERGAQLLPRPGSASGAPARASPASPGAHRPRTAADYRFGAAVARGTPGSGTPRGRPLSTGAAGAPSRFFSPPGGGAAGGAHRNPGGRSSPEPLRARLAARALGAAPALPPPPPPGYRAPAWGPIPPYPAWERAAAPPPPPPPRPPPAHGASAGGRSPLAAPSEGQSGDNAKARALALVKARLRPRLDRGALDRDQYRALARAAVRALWPRLGVAGDVGAAADAAVAEVLADVGLR
jgi:hypothetical protein